MQSERERERERVFGCGSGCVKAIDTCMVRFRNLVQRVAKENWPMWFSAQGLGGVEQRTGAGAGAGTVRVAIRTL